MKKIYKTIIIITLLLISSILLFIPTLKNINFGLDLQGGFEVLYKIYPLEGKKLTKEDIDNTYKAIVNRIDVLGVSEPSIAIEGKDILRIQLPGVENEMEAREIISTTALLSFRDTNDNLIMTSAILGSKGASVDTDPESLKSVIKLSIADTKQFYDVTKEVSKYQDNRIVIWLDYEENDTFKENEITCGEEENTKCLSAAFVEEGLNSKEVVIKGNFTKAKASRLVELINAGSLPTKLVEDSAPHTVSASFGSNTIVKAGYAGLLALALISILLIFKYRFVGFVSSVCLILYSLLTFLLFNGIGGVLTLPGIAALILGVGMAVDSSIILIDRIKDEYKDDLHNAYIKGSKRSLGAILDANITTLIVAVILYIFGQSSIKGFATMLIISLIVTSITMLFINRILIKSVINSRAFNKKENILFGNIHNKTKYDFVKFNKFAVIGLIIVLFLGGIFFYTNKLNLGIDFSGGTSINMSSKNKINFDEIIPLVSEYNVEKYDYYMGTEKEGYIRLNEIIKDNDLAALNNSFNDANINVSINEISTMVVQGLTKNAIYSLLISFAAIIIYVAIRFSFNYGIAGIAALIHDVVLILIVFIIFKLEFDFIIVAALLTIIGYSINDTIVVFDRIRENKANIKTKEDLKNLMNKSMNEVLSRNILTTLTTLLAVISLIVLGINEIFTFNIAILVGLIGGCISSIVFAPNLWRILEQKNIGKVKKKKVIDEIDELSVKGINS